MTVTVDILIRTYATDFPWLVYCLEALTKYARGFGQVLVVVPEVDVPQAAVICAPHPAVRLIAWKPRCDDGYLDQQITKLAAPSFSNAHAFFHVDADCIFFRPFSPWDFFNDWRQIRLLMTPYAALGDTVPWRPVIQKFIKGNVEYEYMRRLPMMFFRDTYILANAHSLVSHGVSIETYVREQPFREFSEFNALGAVARETQEDCYEFIDTTKHPLPAAVCTQFWSWGGITPEIREKIRGHIDRGAP